MSSASDKNSSIVSMRPLPASGPFPTLDPFLFCVYHKDLYPEAANEEMESAWPGNGMDFDPDAPYRMYHGDRIPGFPQHPHRGFETITATIEGLVDHADSVGNAGRYGQGDLQWMTAGRGVVHSEMFPLLKMDDENPLRFFQIWLNLPKKSKMVPPGFAMFWAKDVPVYHLNNNNNENDNEKETSVTLWAGRDYWNAGDNNAPPPDSWAADPNNDVAIWHICLPKAAASSLTLPPARFGNEINRSLYYLEGKDQGVTLNGKPLMKRSMITVQAADELVLQRNDDSSDDPVELLLLQGRPIAEPVAQHGPFVMNTQAEIQQAFRDYSKTQFGGWPWPRDDMVFDRAKGRFALQKGVETTPNDDDALQDETCQTSEPTQTKD